MNRRFGWIGGESFVVTGETLRQTTIGALFIEEIVRTYSEENRDKKCGVDVASTHPGHGENEDTSTKRVFEIRLHRFTQFDGDEFGRNIQHDNDKAGKHLALVQRENMGVDVIAHFEKGFPWVFWHRGFQTPAFRLSHTRKYTLICDFRPFGLAIRKRMEHYRRLPRFRVLRGLFRFPPNIGYF